MTTDRSTRVAAAAAATGIRVHAWRSRPQARLRLFCFHPAGSGASFYRDWPERLPEDVEVVAVSLPGREGRFAQPCLTDYPQAVAALSAALQPHLAISHRPYAFFGHSMGALLAYGVAREAARLGRPGPARLFLSGCAGPGAVVGKPDRHTWSDAQLVVELRELGGTPEAVLNDPELLQLVLPTLRADYGICDSFRRQPLGGPLLDCPVSVLGGADDEHTEEQLGLWSTATRGGFSQRVFPGGHFFLAEQSAAVVADAVAADLRGLAVTAPGARPV
jgi:medium-chain acyl-[acyl-carrier-protein] hydrolase